MIDARHYHVREALSNGLHVQVRSLRPDDDALIAEAFSKLEPESIYARFFCIKKGVTDHDLRLIRELDFDTRVVLVVTVIKAGRETIIGSGSFSRFAADAAEAAFLVEEDYHGLGIAGRVLRHLVLIARDRGIVRFEADVLPNNKAMLRVFAKSGLPMTLRHEDGVIHTVLDLAGKASRERRAKSIPAQKHSRKRLK